MAEPSWQSGPSFSLSIKCTRCLPRGPQCIQVNMRISSNVCVFSPLFSLSALWMPDRVSTWFSPLFFLSALWMPFQESTRRRKHVCIYYRGQHHRPQPSPASQNSENPSALYTKFDAGSLRESVVVLAQHLRPRPFDSWMICHTLCVEAATSFQFFTTDHTQRASTHRLHLSCRVAQLRLPGPLNRGREKWNTNMLDCRQV